MLENSWVLKQKRGPGRLLHNARIQSTTDRTTRHPGSGLGRRAGAALPHFNLVTTSIWSLHLAWFSLLAHFSHAFHPYQHSLPSPQPPLESRREHGRPGSLLGEKGQTAPGRSPGFGQVLPDKRRPSLSWHSTYSLGMKNDPPAYTGYRNKLFFDQGVPSAVVLFSAQGRHVTWASPSLCGAWAGVARGVEANIRPSLGQGGTWEHN